MKNDNITVLAWKLDCTYKRFKSLVDAAMFLNGRDSGYVRDAILIACKEGYGEYKGYYWTFDFPEDQKKEILDEILNSDN